MASNRARFLVNLAGGGDPRRDTNKGSQSNPPHRKPGRKAPLVLKDGAESNSTKRKPYQKAGKVKLFNPHQKPANAPVNGRAQSNPLQRKPDAKVPENSASLLGHTSKVVNWLNGLPCRKKLQFTPPKKKVSKPSNEQHEDQPNHSKGTPTKEQPGICAQGERDENHSTALEALQLSKRVTKPRNGHHNDQTDQSADGTPVREQTGLPAQGQRFETFPKAAEAPKLSDCLLEPSNLQHNQTNLFGGIPTIEQTAHNTANKESVAQAHQTGEVLNLSESLSQEVPLHSSFTDLLLPVSQQSAWQAEDSFTPTITVLGIQTADNQVFSYTGKTLTAAVPCSPDKVIDLEDVSSPNANLESQLDNGEITDNSKYVTSPAIPIRTQTATPSNISLDHDDYLNNSEDLFSLDDPVENSTPRATQIRTFTATPTSGSLDPDDNSNNSGAVLRLADSLENVTPQATRKRTRTATPNSGSPVRKRSRNQAMWKSNTRKLATNTGQEYVSSRGKLVKAREMRPPCSCKLDCIHRVSEEERKRQFDTFWALGNHERQWEFIRNFSKTQPTKGKTLDQEPQKRHCFRSFFFEIGGKKIIICKKMFMATLSIWDGWIDSAYSHVNQAKGKVATPDKRGRHGNDPKQITPEKINTVKEHVAEFPRVPSHYCRARTKREFLQRGLSLRKMAKLYRTWAETRKIPLAATASIRQYEDIVNSNFNLGFFKPKKDQCKLCVFMTSKDNSPRLKQQYKNVYATHIKNKQLMKKIKEQDKSAAEKDRTIAMCSFDLQKQLCLPHSQASPFYYKSKLNVYNFTVFHSIKRMGICYLWHEGMARKGSDEVASSILNFIGRLVEEGYKVFIFYSDNCAGQNKNRFIFSMYELAAVLYSVKITHKYLEPGHTMMEVDSIHARIELSTKDSEIFDFVGWVEAIENAKEELPKYKVIPFKKGFVRTFKPLVEMQNWESDLNGNKVKWSQVKEIQIDGTEGNLVRIKYSYDGDIVTLSPNKPGRPVNLKTYTPPQAYNGGIPLSANTIRDLKKLLTSNAIPELKQPFYHQVLAECSETINEAASEASYDPVEDLCVGDTLEEQTEVQEEEME